MGPGLTRNFFSVENHPKIVLKQCRYFVVVYHVYSVCIYIVSYYDLSVHVSDGFPKKS